MKEATLAPHAHTPVLVGSNGSRGRAIKTKDDSANREHLHVTRKVVNKISNRPFQMYQINVLKKVVHIPKRMAVMHLTNSPVLTISFETAVLETDPETTCAVDYELSVDRQKYSDDVPQKFGNKR